ncbi:MAG: hypothetical protein Q7V05_07580 [Methanoregula sp.]|nr:hypothetical protein [Methanoregula sp.]
MKKIVLFVMGLVFLSGFASAYQINIDAPVSLSVGKPLIVTGTTNLGIGTPIDVVLYYQLTTSTEVERKVVYVLSDKTFKTFFDTSNLKKGTYKVEVPAPGLGSSSVNMRIIQLIDRDDEISITSLLRQSFNGRMYIAGSIKGGENSGIQIEIVGPSNTVVFGPSYVNTNNAGLFSADISITEPGDYEVSFTDAKGFIGTRTISITGEPTMGVTPVATATTYPVFSAHAKASRNSPAYFVVRTASGPVVLHTSSSIDWVIEYVDDKGVLHMANNQGAQNPERAEFIGTGKLVYVKIYPYKYADNSEVFLYAENVYSVVVSPTIPEAFAATAPHTPTETPQSPLFPLGGLGAVGIVVLLQRK